MWFVLESLPPVRVFIPWLPCTWVHIGISICGFVMCMLQSVQFCLFSRMHHTSYGLQNLNLL